MKIHRGLTGLAAVVAAVGAVAALHLFGAGAAGAAGTGTATTDHVQLAASSTCFHWNRTLRQGASGEDVTQLQIRVAGWPGYRHQIAIDGQFGPDTAAAVKRFQAAYHLPVTGIGDGRTFSLIYSMQDADCTPIHFSYSELNHCNSSWAGGRVSAARAKANAFRTMWQLEALRHALGDHPLTVNSGFRSVSCNAAVGGASDSQHQYGTAADLAAGSSSLCTIAKEARNHGFGGIFGPGYPGHSNHIHVDIRPGAVWSASRCGI